MAEYDVNIVIEVNGEQVEGKSTVMDHPDILDFANLATTDQLWSAALRTPITAQQSGYPIMGNRIMSYAYLSEDGVTVDDFMTKKPKVVHTGGSIGAVGFSKDNKTYCVNNGLTTLTTPNQVDVNTENLDETTLPAIFNTIEPNNRETKSTNLVLKDQVIKLCVGTSIKTETIRNTTASTMTFNYLDFFVGDISFLYSKQSNNQYARSHVVPSAIIRIKFKNPIVIEAGNTFRLDAIFRFFAKAEVKNKIERLDGGITAITVPLYMSYTLPNSPSVLNYVAKGGSSSLKDKEYGAADEGWSPKGSYGLPAFTFYNTFMRGVQGRRIGYAVGAFNNFTDSNTNVPSIENSTMRLAEINRNSKWQNASWTGMDAGGLYPNRKKVYNELFLGKPVTDDFYKILGEYLLPQLEGKDSVPNELLTLLPTGYQSSPSPHNAVFGFTSINIQRSFGTTPSNMGILDSWIAGLEDFYLTDILEENVMKHTLGVAESATLPTCKLYGYTQFTQIPIGIHDKVIAYATFLFGTEGVDPDYRQSITIEATVDKPANIKAPTLGEPT